MLVWRAEPECIEVIFPKWKVGLSDLCKMKFNMINFINMPSFISFSLFMRCTLNDEHESELLPKNYRTVIIYIYLKTCTEISEKGQRNNHILCAMTLNFNLYQNVDETESNARAFELNKRMRSLVIIVMIFIMSKFRTSAFILSQD